MNNEDKPKYFLETNTQFHRICGTQRQKDIVNAVIKDSICYSSYFVKKEFYELVIKPLGEFYFFLENYQTITEAAKEFIQEYSFKNRKIKSFFISFLNGFSHFQQLQAQSEVLVYIQELNDRFIEVITYMIDKVQCPVMQRIELTSILENIDDYDDEYKCPKICCLEIFLKQNKNKLNPFITIDIKQIKIDSDHKKEFDKLLEIYKNIVNNNPILPTERIKLHDTIIALECPSTTCLLTFDKIFDTLCPIMNIQYKLLKHPPKTFKRIKNKVN